LKLIFERADDLVHGHLGALRSGPGAMGHRGGAEARAGKGKGAREKARAADRRVHMEQVRGHSGPSAIRGQAGDEAGDQLREGTFKPSPRRGLPSAFGANAGVSRPAGALCPSGVSCYP